MSGSQFDDVRMRGFQQRAEVADVLALLESRTAPLSGEAVPLSEAADRVLVEAVVSTVNVPNFARSAMDGFAVCASEATKLRELVVVGESLPACPFAGEMKPGEAVRIMTGAPIPSGADAVLMAELAQVEVDGRVTARAAISPGKHVIRIGEDVASGSEVLPVGRRLRPQDVGLLASIGVASVNVVRKPRVAILITGNELLPPGAMPVGFQIVDSNSPMLAALATRDGAMVLPVRYAPDSAVTIRDALLAASTEADVILISGGTSLGTEDHAPRVAAELGELAVHGVALRPAGPLGVGFLASGRRKLAGESDVPHQPAYAGRSPILFLIPGNPVSCLCAYDLFIGRVIRRLGGRSWELPYRRVTRALASDITSAAGRVDYVRVKVESERAKPLPTGGASNLSNAVAADGFVLVPSDRDRLAVGEEVEVWLYD